LRGVVVLLDTAPRVVRDRTRLPEQARRALELLRWHPGRALGAARVVRLTAVDHALKHRGASDLAAQRFDDDLAPQGELRLRCLVAPGFGVVEHRTLQGRMPGDAVIG